MPAAVVDRVSRNCARQGLSSGIGGADYVCAVVCDSVPRPVHVVQLRRQPGNFFFRVFYVSFCSRLRSGDELHCRWIKPVCSCAKRWKKRLEPLRISKICSAKCVGAKKGKKNLNHPAQVSANDASCTAFKRQIDALSMQQTSKKVCRVGFAVG